MPPPLGLLLVAAAAAVRALAGAIELPECHADQISNCSRNQICVEVENKCRCMAGFIFDPKSETLEDACVKEKTDPGSSGGSGAAILITLITLMLILLAIVLIVRRYNLMDWFRRRISRRDNSVMYEDVMIGQDDPPIAA